MKIEYLEELKTIKKDRFLGGYLDQGKRIEYVKEYSWAIPNAEAIETIRKHSGTGIVEIGAGNGYWASLIAQDGTKVKCYDTKPYHHGYCNDKSKEYYEVTRATHNVTSWYKHWTLMLCWPPHWNDMAFRALEKYRGNKVIYIGEGYGGCTGTDEFFDLLDKEWNNIVTVDIPSWSGIRDMLFVFEKK
jgi:SAM-dependent methyltransferase